MAKLKRFFYVFERMISIFIPELYNFLLSNNIKVNYFISSWFITLFTNAYQYIKVKDNPKIILKIFDFFFFFYLKSIIVTSISLYVSWIGYMQSQEAAKKADKASEQAAEASQNAADASEKLDKIRRYEVLGAEIKNELSKAKELQKDLDKAQVYLAILTRLKENDYFQPGVKNNLEKAINSLNKRLGYMIHEIFYEIDANKEALANAEGLIDVCIDKLQGKG